MWTVIYITPSVKIADRIQHKLSEEGFLVKIQQDTVSNHYEVLVPESELDEIQEILSTMFH
jgi:hypothetical protein